MFPNLFSDLVAERAGPSWTGSLPRRGNRSFPQHNLGLRRRPPRRLHAPRTSRRSALCRPSSLREIQPQNSQRSHWPVHPTRIHHLRLSHCCMQPIRHLRHCHPTQTPTSSRAVCAPLTPFLDQLEDPGVLFSFCSSDHHWVWSRSAGDSAEATNRCHRPGAQPASAGRTPTASGVGSATSLGGTSFSQVTGRSSAEWRLSSSRQKVPPSSLECRPPSTKPSSGANSAGDTGSHWSC